MSEPKDVGWVPDIWAEAWEVYSRHGNQKGAMKELRIGAAVLRRRLKGYAEATGQELPTRNRKPPAKLNAKHVAAWEALDLHNNYEAAAASLGIHRNSLRLRLADLSPIDWAPSGCSAKAKGEQAQASHGGHDRGALGCALDHARTSPSGGGPARGGQAAGEHRHPGALLLRLRG